MKRSPWVPLDANFQDDEQIIELSAEAELLFIRSMAQAKRLDNGGAVRRAQLRRLADKLTSDPTTLAMELVAVGLWTPVPSGAAEPEPVPSGWLITSWADWNDRADVRRRSMSDGGKRGNHERWQHPGPFETCGRCNKESTGQTPPGDETPGQSGGDRPPSPETRRDETRREPPPYPPSPRSGPQDVDGDVVVRVADQLMTMIGVLDDGASSDEIEMVRLCLGQHWTEQELLQCARDARSKPDVADTRRYLYGMLRRRAGGPPDRASPPAATRGEAPPEGGWTARCRELNRCALDPPCPPTDERQCLGAPSRGSHQTHEGHP